MTQRATVRLRLAVIIVVASALMAVTTGRAEVVMAAAPWAVLLVLGLGRGDPPRLRVTLRPVARRMVAGDELELRYAVDTDRAGTVEITPRPSPRFWGEGRGVVPPTVVEAVVAARPMEVSCPLVGGEWGTHDVGAAAVVFHQPYGLIQWRGAIVGEAAVRVHPSPPELRSLLAPILHRRQAGAHPSASIDRGVEYADIRPFEPGDLRRDINWRASARRDELWVSRRHPERAADVILLLDSLVESGHDVRSSVGAAVEVAMAVADGHVAAADRVGLVELGGVVRWVPLGSGSTHLQRLIDALLATRLFANAAERELSLVPPRALPPRSLVVALSPLHDTRFVDALVTLRHRGHDVVVIECGVAREGSDDRRPAGSTGGGAGTDRPPETRVGRLARRLWEAERVMLIDELAHYGIAVGRWDRHEPLDPVLRALGRQRRRRAGVRG
ncbi:MAG: DUF58 domain-containing protein [Acidimicrobiales bacterium]